VDILKELHKQDPMSTNVGAAMASNTTLYTGDVGLSPATSGPLSSSPTKSQPGASKVTDKVAPLEKPKMMPNFFKKK
jgi:hypothetical protein